MADKKCPNCNLWNDESALRCDCGYDFASGEVKSAHANSKEEGKVRGSCFTAVLVFVGFSSFAMVYLALTMQNVFPLPVLTIILSAIQFVFCIAVWKWKKWGVYGLITILIITMVLNRVMSDAPIQNNFGLIIAPLLYIGVLFILIKQRWHLFE